MDKNNREKSRIFLLLLAYVIYNMEKNEKLTQAILVTCEK